jgi:hypothetical protein
MKVLLRFLLALLLIAVAVRADEIRLKDGTKITGTIVGFEDGAFKVQTSYGFALVRKDQIAEIIPSAPKPAPAPPAPKPTAKPADTGASAAAAATPAEPPTGTASAPSATSATSNAPSTSSTSVPVVAPAARTTSAKAAHARTAASATTAAMATAASEPSAAPASSTSPMSTAAQGPAAESKPQPIRDEVVGTLYMNHTFGFDIYKPPDWALLPEELNSLPNAVTALGTDDGTTLLLVGREARKGALEAQAAATDAQLHDIYDNFRLLSTSRANIAGEPAIERHFRGTAEDRDWSVTVVSVAQRVERRDRGFYLPQ